MATTYKAVRWAFDGAWFSGVLSEWVANFGTKEVGDMLSVSKSTVHNWCSGNWSDDFPHPHMSNFLVFCNETDTDPRDYFTLEDCE